MNLKNKELGKCSARAQQKQRFLVDQMFNNTLTKTEII